MKVSLYARHREDKILLVGPTMTFPNDRTGIKHSRSWMRNWQNSLDKTYAAWALIDNDAPHDKETA